MTQWRLLAGVVLVLGLAGVLTVSLIYGLTGSDFPFDHGIVIDAGSSHSQVTLYSWKGNKYYDTGCVTQVDTCGVDDGLSSFAIPKMAGDSLLPCLRTVSKSIPEEKRSTSPVFVGATAGMRILDIAEPFQNLAIFTAVECMLPKSGLEVRDVGIISGESEGFFAWITTNFLLGIIQKRQHQTVGALDMGGASTQISFEVAAEHKGNANVFTRKLYGEDYHVYSVSYLCYGMNEVYRRYFSILADDPGTTGIIKHHCAPIGTEVNFTAQYLFDQPCTTTKRYREWVISNEEKLNQTYYFKGTGNVEECRKIVARLYDFKDCSSKFKECFKPIDPLIMPEAFMAFSSFFYTTSYFNATNTTRDNFQEILDTFCRLKWKDAEQIKSPSADNRFINRYCFQGQVIHHLLINGYGFTTATWPNIQFTKKVNDTDVGWSLGYMINATNAIPEELPNSPIISLPVFIIVLLICVVFCVLFFVFLHKHETIKKPSGMQNA